MRVCIPKRLKQSIAYHAAPGMEREVAAKAGGRTTLASGSKEEKADVRVTGAARIECKATSRKSFTVTREMLDKVCEAGEGSGEFPYIVVKFLPIKGHAGGTVIVAPEYVMNQLLQTLQT